MTQHWWFDGVKIDGKNVMDGMYRIFFGENDHLVDLGRD
jgi:hypothetical protein